MTSVKLTDEERNVLRRLGKRAWKDTKKRLKNIPAERQPTAQGHHGKKGGRKPKYPPCETNGRHNKRHRFWDGKCSLCGTKQASE